MSIIVPVLRRLTDITALLLTLGGAALIVALILTLGIIKDLPSVPEPLRRIIETPATEIYAANGERILQIGGHDYVPLDQVAIDFLQAILATEDHRFWEHHGINKMRTLKALWTTIADGRLQGASTITQQLAKNLFFSFEQTYARKVKELLVSFQIESQFSKHEILEAYVNQIYFEPRAQGIASAARHFFGKRAAQLSLAESALLAGLPKSPTRYNPLRYPDRAKTRQQIVLARMVAAGFISPTEAEAAAAEPLTFGRQGGEALVGEYFVDWVLKDLEDRYGAQVVYHGGLKVTTTVDLQLQRLAESVLVQGLQTTEGLLQPPSATDGADEVQGALVSVQVNSGAVKAMVGGRDYAHSEFNRAVAGNRLPGSGFKPFLYYTAFERLGLTPASVLKDQPVSLAVDGASDWRPRNFRREYQGPLILKKAFAESVNSIAAQLVALTGPQPVIDTARRCGIESPLAPVYSVALGTSGVSPLEMAAAFGTLAAGGMHYSPFGVWRVEDWDGQVLEEHIVSGEQVLDPRLTYQVVDLLQGVL
ncbi:MAG: carboxypeptidase, partial [Desulfatitalea sp.]|nr:transglycosylase domain-containing protein [Desulfatitalea sp.]NNJ99834.1 carboxypeptidase [Desulfatitalea sp.]